MPFTFHVTDLPGVMTVTPKSFSVNRGFFMETYKKSVFKESGIAVDFVQDNHSASVQNVLRGLHFQVPPFAQDKLVRVVEGRIFDVAVDLRKGGETFGSWEGHELSAENRKMLYVPVGFAHGFLTLSATAQVEYKVSAEYSPEHERGVVWDDPEIGIDWPVREPILAEKDAILPRLSDCELFGGTP